MDSFTRFLNKLRELIKGRIKDGDLTEEEYNEAVKSARGHVGGTVRWENAKAEGSQMNEWKLLSELALSEDGRTAKIQIFPKVQTYQHPRYGEMDISQDFLSEVKKHFDAKTYQQELPLTIDLEHESKLSGAAGWIKDLSIEGDKGMFATIEFNDRGASLVGDGGYKYFSPEFYDIWVDPATSKEHKNVLIGGALTNRPFFKGMAPVAMMREDSLLFVEAAGENKQTAEGDGMDELMEHMQAMMALMGKMKMPEAMMGEMDALMQKMKKGMPKDMPDKMPDKASEAGDQNLQGGESMGMTEDETRQFREMGDTLKSLNERLAAEEVARKAAETEAKTASERVQGLEREANRRTLSEFVRGHRLAFSETEIPQAVDKLERMQAKLGEDFDGYLTEKRSLHERIETSDLFRQTGMGGSGSAPNGALAEFEAAKRKVMSEHPGMAEADAIAKVASENPRLYNAYDASFKQRIRKGE